MADFVPATSQIKQVWVTKFLAEYVRESTFGPYVGKSANAIFQVRTELQEEAGKYINLPLFGRLKGAGVTGSQMLDGNEDDLSQYSDQIVIDWLRNAVRVPKSSQYVTEINILDAAKSALRTWDAEQLRNSLIAALGSIIIPASVTNGPDTAVAYASATAAQRNTFLTNNADRVLFGNAKANGSSNVWATALATVDNTNDKLSASIGSLAKRMAKLADPHIRPYKTEDGREYFVMFCNPYAFRDLKNDTAMQNANRDARAREGSAMDKNPLFQDGDMIYDGVIFREVPELTQLTVVGAGTAGIDVGQNFLCGSQAVGIAYGQQPKPIIDTLKDFQFRPGVAIEELRGQKKTSWGNGVQYGVVNVLTAAVAD